MEKTLTEAQLYTLLESMRLINSTLDLDELLAIIMNEITENLNAERSTLYIVDHGKQEIWSKIAQGDKKLIIRQTIGKGISGYVAESGKLLNIKDAYSDPRFNPEIDRKSGFRTRSVLCIPVFDMNKRIIAILQILNKKDGFFSPKDQTFTSVFADYISLAIQNAQLYQEALERKRLESEIAVAAEIQKMLLPSQLPQLQDYEVYAFQQPSRFIGGDYYDFFHKSDNLYFVLADVAGKGTPAALLMANLQATVHNLLGKCQDNQELVAMINNHLFSVTPIDKYATLVWGDLDLKTDSFQYIIAGHIPPLLFKQKDQTIKVTELTVSNIPVGMLPKVDFQQGSIDLEPGELLFICSDGITEAQNKRNQMFDDTRLINIVKRNINRRLEEIGSKIIQRVKAFAKGGAYEDDITLLMIRRKPE